jgi:hypothetical protein
MLSVGPDGAPPIGEWTSAIPVFVFVGFDLREAGVELGWNAVFAREVEAAGFLRPVLCVIKHRLKIPGPFNLSSRKSRSTV